jgi:hypothetical protein
MKIQIAAMLSGRRHRDRPAHTIAEVDLGNGQREFNTALSKLRSAAEHTIAHLKTPRRKLSQEATGTEHQSKNTNAS